MNYTRLLLLFLTFLAIAGEAATLGLSPDDADQVHACVESEIEKEAGAEQQEEFEASMEPCLSWDLALATVPVVMSEWRGHHAHLRHERGVKHRRHRLLEVDLN